MSTYRNIRNVFSEKNTFEYNKQLALDILGFASVDDCIVGNMTVDTEHFLASDESKKWSRVFGELVYYFGCKSLDEVKELAEAYFTPEFYNENHGGFTSALMNCSMFIVYFAYDTFSGVHLKFYKN